MKKEVKRSELLDILRVRYSEIPEDVDITMSEEGEVFVYCPGFIHPKWMDIPAYMNPNATIEVYNFSEDENGYEWELIEE